MLGKFADISETCEELGANILANIYLFKSNNRNTRKRCEILLKVNNKWHQNDVSEVALVPLLSNMYMYKILKFSMFFNFYTKFQISSLTVADF